MGTDDLQDQVLVRTLESLGVLAGGIAHDFNNLLTVISGNAQLAMGQGTPPATQEHLRQILRATERAAELCRQLLLCSGRSSNPARPVDLSALLRDVLEATPLPPHVTLRRDLPADLPAIQGDMAQLRQVAANLISNACEALGDAPGEVRVACGTTECDAACIASAVFSGNVAPGTFAYIEVADTGCGMSRETIQRMFDPFYSTKFIGRGLGLAAVLGVVRGHAGMIQVQSVVAQGTVFRVLLPVASPHSARAAALETATRHTASDSAVLIVDDEETVLSVAQRALERAGWAVVTARNGLEAVELFRRRHRQIACVLLDLSMPGMDGEETLSRLRNIRPDVPVLLSSGYSQREVGKRFAHKDVAGFIPKPYQLDELLRRVREAAE